MREYIVVYTYTGNFVDTYNIMVKAKSYGAVAKNIKKVFREGVEMTAQEARKIIDGEWYYIITLDDEESYVIEEGG